MYVQRHNPHATTIQRRGLGDLGAPSLGAFSLGPIDSVARSLNTPTSSLLILLGGGLVVGWLANDLVTGTKKALRRTRAAIRKRRSAAQTVFAPNDSNQMLLVLIAMVLAVGTTYYFTARKNGGV